jgi:hypothetical protein
LRFDIVTFRFRGHLSSQEEEEMPRTAPQDPEGYSASASRGFGWDTPCAFNDRQKDRFHRVGRAQMRRLADELGLEPGSYEIRSNKGGPAVSGEVTLHHERIYVQASQTGDAGTGLLVRTCEGTRDFTGGRNNHAPLGLLDDTEALADRVRLVQPELDRRRVPSPA